MPKFQGVGGPIFSPDGKTLAVMQGDAIRLWDISAEEPKERAVLPNSVAPLAFSPDGKTLACNGLEKDGMLYRVLWNLRAAEPKVRVVLKPTIPNLPAHTGVWPQPLAWTQDGKTLASFWPGVVLLWDMSKSKPTHELLLEVGTDTTSLALAPDGQTVAVSTTGGLSLWDVSHPTKPKRRSWRLPGPVLGVTFAQDGRHLFTANANGTVYVLRLEKPSGKHAE